MFLLGFNCFFDSTSLYVGEYGNALYALPVLVDEDTVTIAVSIHIYFFQLCRLSLNASLQHRSVGKFEVLTD